MNIFKIIVICLFLFLIGEGIYFLVGHKPGKIPAVSSVYEIKELKNSGLPSGEARPVINDDQMIYVGFTSPTVENIYLYDLVNDKETQITHNTKPFYGSYNPQELSYSNPDIYGNLVGWLEKGTPNFEQIKIYDLTSNEIINLTNDNYGVFENETGIYYRSYSSPKIYENKVIWFKVIDSRQGPRFEQSFTNFINIYDATTKEITTTILDPDSILIKSTGLSTSNLAGLSFRVYKNTIVWCGFADKNNLPESATNRDIFVYDISTGAERQITTNQYWQCDPDIYEDKIIWLDSRNVVSKKNTDYYPNITYFTDTNIYMYDLSQNKEIPITSDFEYRSEPRIYGDKIVWSAPSINKPSINTSEVHLSVFIANTSIFLYDLSKNQEIQLTPNAFHDSFPAISRDKVVWLRVPSLTLTDKEIAEMFSDISKANAFQEQALKNTHFYLATIK